MKKLFILISIIIFSINAYSAGPPNPNCTPFSSCWCAQNPGHPKCNPAPCFPPQACVPINEGILLLAFAGFCLAIVYTIYKIPLCPPHNLVFEDFTQQTMNGTKRDWRWRCKDCNYIQEKTY